jgi:hypothetical protein
MNGADQPQGFDTLAALIAAILVEPERRRRRIVSETPWPRLSLNYSYHTEDHPVRRAD